jgi:hypothetical protein
MILDALQRIPLGAVLGQVSSQMDTERPYVQPVWEYSVVDEPNPRALQQRLAVAGLEGWEAVGLTSTGDARFIVLLERRSVSTSR